VRGVDVRRFVPAHQNPAKQFRAYELSKYELAEGARGQGNRASRFWTLPVVPLRSRFIRVPAFYRSGVPHSFYRRVRVDFRQIAPTPRLILRIRGSSLRRKSRHAESQKCDGRRRGNSRVDRDFPGKVRRDWQKPPSEDAHSRAPKTTLHNGIGPEDHLRSGCRRGYR